MNLSKDIDTFFNPQGIVLVGATATPGFGYALPLLLQKQGWSDRLHLVNPKGGTLHGMLVYRRVADVPDPVDLAVVIVPARTVPGVLEDIAGRGIKHVIVESAGFAETGSDGKVLQTELKKAIKKLGLRVIGPNCVGLVNNANGFSTTETIPEAFTPGNTAIIAQSGLFGNILLDKLHLQNLFVSKAVTLGNHIDVSESEMLDYFHRDPLTQVVMMYLEGASDGRLLTRTLSRVTKNKPVLILKSGRTAQGLVATASHTGSLSGVDGIYGAMCSQTGAIRASDLTELIDFTRVFSALPLPQGPRLGIVTGSGSMGALATDEAVTLGLEIPKLSRTLTEEISAVAPGWMNVKNPLDVGPSGLFEEALSAMLSDPGIDMVLAIATVPHQVFRTFKEKGLEKELRFGDIAALRKTFSLKPFIVCVVGHDEFRRYMVEQAGPLTPVFDSPEAAARALAALWRYRCWKDG